MNRQQIREEQRKARTFDERNSFSPEETRQMLNIAYEMGVEHALEAVAMVYGLGPKRLDKIKARLEWLQIADFERNDAVKRAEQINVHRVKLNRATRRAANPTKKGAALFK